MVDDFKAGKLVPHLKSQDLPSGWDAERVGVLAWSSREEVVCDVSKDVFMEFYVPWRGHCERLESIWDKLGDQISFQLKISSTRKVTNTNEWNDRFQQKILNPV